MTRLQGRFRAHNLRDAFRSPYGATDSWLGKQPSTSFDTNYSKDAIDREHPPLQRGDKLMENKVTHLKLIIDLLDMANRSDVYAKRWAVSFTAVFIALGTQQQGFRIAYLAILPMFLLWLIDAQNYRRDYLLKKLYDRVRATPEDQIDFSIDIETLPDARRGTFRWMFCSSALTFYGAMIAGVCIVDAFVL
jgi:hypothetical protein